MTAPSKKPNINGTSHQHSLPPPVLLNVDAMDIDAPPESAANVNKKAKKPHKFKPASVKEMSNGKTETRKVLIPPHRQSPLKKEWLNLYTPLVENMGLQVRYNIKSKSVELRTCAQTTDTSALQKGHDFVRAYALGFHIDDIKALLRLDELFIDSFEIKDVKSLQGDHLSRCIGRIAGKSGKIKFTIENASRTRIVVADTKIHILGSFSNIRLAKDAIVALIMGSPPGKVTATLTTVSARLKERF